MLSFVCWYGGEALAFPSAMVLPRPKAPLSFRFRLPDFDTIVVAGMIVFVIGGLFVAPATGFYRTANLQKMLNSECGIKASFLEVATNGDQLIALCKIKNQTFSIRQ